MAQPKHNISAERATDLLRSGKPVYSVYIEGELRIETYERWDKEVIFKNCLVEKFSGSVTQFHTSVRLENCHFINCQFVFTYFLGGLTIDHCTFDNYLAFQAGGHNAIGNPVTFNNNVFKDFVNFFDGQYEGEISFGYNRFEGGTNLLGRPYGIPVTFGTAPTMRENVGQLDLNHEGKGK